MVELKLYYATNRNHIGNRWHPKSYGTKFSNDGMENLRFGIVRVSADDKIISKHLTTKMKDCGVGNGEALGSYLAGCAKNARIDAYEEAIKSHIADVAQEGAKFGSKMMFADVKV